MAGDIVRRTLMGAVPEGVFSCLEIRFNSSMALPYPLKVLEDAGNAGDININAADTLRMKNSSITTEATYSDGGNIYIKAGYMVELIDSKITASVGGGPQTTGGNITIDPEYVILNDSQIIANAYEGKGGNIRIIADVFLASPDSIVDASSALGIDGTVNIQAPITKYQWNFGTDAGELSKC